MVYLSASPEGVAKLVPGELKLSGMSVLGAAARGDRHRLRFTDPPWTMVGIYTSGRLLAPPSRSRHFPGIDLGWPNRTYRSRRGVDPAPSSLSSSAATPDHAGITTTTNGDFYIANLGSGTVSVINPG
jgi:hypothetical protein